MLREAAEGGLPRSSKASGWGGGAGRACAVVSSGFSRRHDVRGFAECWCCLQR